MSSVLLKSWYLEQVSIIQGFILVFSLISSFIAVKLLRTRRPFAFSSSFTLVTNYLYFEHRNLSGSGKSPAFKPYPDFPRLWSWNCWCRELFPLPTGKYLSKRQKIYWNSFASST